MSNVSVLFGKGPGKAGVKRHHKVLCDNIQVFSTAFKDSRTTPNEFSTTVYEFLKDIGNAFKAFATTNGVFRLFEFIASVFGSLKDIGIAFKAFPFIIYVLRPLFHFKIYPVLTFVVSVSTGSLLAGWPITPPPGYPTDTMPNPCSRVLTVPAGLYYTLKDGRHSTLQIELTVEP